MNSNKISFTQQKTNIFEQVENIGLKATPIKNYITLLNDYINLIVTEAIQEHENNRHNEDELEFSHDHKQYKIKEYD